MSNAPSVANVAFAHPVGKDFHDLDSCNKVPLEVALDAIKKELRDEFQPK